MDQPRVLVVDDDRRVARALECLLSAEDCSVEYAESGAAALESLERGAVFDAIVVDQNLGRERGSELLELIRDRWPDVIRVLYSGNPASFARADPAHAFMTKPWTRQAVDALISLVRAHQKRRHEAPVDTYS